MQTNLTKGEWELVEAILSNKVTYADLAIACKISIHTVNALIGSIYVKTGARNMPELILMASGRTEVACAA